MKKFLLVYTDYGGITNPNNLITVNRVFTNKKEAQNAMKTALVKYLTLWGLHKKCIKQNKANYCQVEYNNIGCKWQILDFYDRDNVIDYKNQLNKSTEKCEAYDDAIDDIHINCNDKDEITERINRLYNDLNNIDERYSNYE